MNTLARFLVVVCSQLSFAHAYATLDLPVPSIPENGAVVSGGYHTLALTNTGQVWAWGDNGTGQLGDTTTTNRPTPVPVSGLTGVTVVAVAAGIQHSVALGSNGVVYTWGANSLGQLGDETTDDSATPHPVLSGVVAIAAGGWFTVALKSDGTVYTWGDDSVGQLGQGGTADQTIPTQVAELPPAKAIGAGAYHMLAVAEEDGSVWTAGNNSDGQLGYGETGGSLDLPVQVSELAGVTAVAAGSYHSLALKSDKTLWAWGQNFYDQVGYGIEGGIINAPVEVYGLTNVMGMAGGDLHAVAVAEGGEVWTWGYNSMGELADGSDTPDSTPVPAEVTAIPNGVAVSSGFAFTVVVKADGTVWAFGSNDYGALGDGSASNQWAPVQVIGLDLTPTPPSGFTDTDYDGMDDAWEMLYFEGLDETATGNFDSDDKNNLQEYLLGRNPTEGIVAGTVETVNLRVYSPNR